MRNGKAKVRDLLVPINQQILRALLEERGLTIAALARRTGDLEQTLSHVVNAPGARCKKSRRAKIARILQVPQELLAGESFPIPLGFMLPDGFEFRYSARTQLAASRFIARVRAALLRDLRTHPIDRKSTGLAPLQVEGAVLSAFSEFMMVGEWRKRFIEWAPGEQQRRGYTEPATVKPWDGAIRVTGQEGDHVFWETSPPRPERDPDHEAAVLGVIRAMEHVLEPWFGGTARLNYRSIRDFVHLPAHPFVTSNERGDPLSSLAILPPAIMMHETIEPHLSSPNKKTSRKQK
ncbi:MAG TPA: helix-turn-helix transcriptional regulator [Gemmatimonadaceae bacterium]